MVEINTNIDKIAVIERLYQSFRFGINNGRAKTPRKWLDKRKLSIEISGVGYNSGQIHHRKKQVFKDILENIGFLKKTDIRSRTGERAYQIFGNHSIIFPLRNEENKVVNFCAITINQGNTVIFNEEGLYPNYPNKNTSRLILAPNILDAATLLEARILTDEEAVLSLFDGTIKPQHLEAIKSLKGLKEILIVELSNNTDSLILRKDGIELMKLIGNLILKSIKLDKDENLNEIFICKGKEALIKKLTKKTDYENIGFPDIYILKTIDEINEEISDIKETKEQDTFCEKEAKPRIETVYDGKLLFKNKLNNYFILGQLSQDLSILPVTLFIEERATGRKERMKIDLFEREDVRYLSVQIAELFYQDNEQVETELLQLTDELEQYRENQIEQYQKELKIRRIYQYIPPEIEKQILMFLKSPNLIANIDKLIEFSGVVGEEKTRKLLFINASTYKMRNPLHTLIQGASGSGKSHLINTIGQCLPSEDVLIMTRITSKSFYHYTGEELIDKILLIQDFDGLDEEAKYAFRELQSSGIVSSSTTYKDKNGNLKSMVKVVKSNFASMLATTQSEIYYDNLSRSIVIGVDESEEQTNRIVEYQNKILAGQIDQEKEREAKRFLQNCIRVLKPFEVINPYADKIKLPIEAKMLRRLNIQYQYFVKQITILHQYQREKDDKGRLIAEPKDLKMASEILFEAIMLKVDDLDASLRQFFNKLKDYIKLHQQSDANEYQFTQREARLALNLSRASCFRYMERLEQLEYVQKAGGYVNKGFKYKIVYWDDIQKIKNKIEMELNKQFETINKSSSF